MKEQRKKRRVSFAFEEKSQQKTSPLQNMMKLRSQQSAHETRESGKTNTPDRAKWLAIRYQCQYCFKICANLSGLTQHRNRKHQTKSGKSAIKVKRHREVPDMKQSSNHVSNIKPHSLQFENGDILTSEDTGTASEGTGTASEDTGTASEGMGTASESMGTASEGMGTASEGMGTASEGTGTASEDTGTASEGTGTASEGTGTASEVFETGVVVGSETRSIQMEETGSVQTKETGSVQMEETGSVQMEETSTPQVGTRKCQCQYCYKVCKSTTGLTLHQRSHFVYNCKFCDQGFSNPSILQEHVAEHHPDQANHAFQCIYCSKSFPTDTAMKQHVESSHDLENPYKCEWCGRTFRSKAYLPEHFRIHQQIPHECELCGKVFTSPRYLRRHINRSHKQ